MHLDLIRLAEARDAVASTDRALTANASELRDARAELSELLRRGATSAAARRAERRVVALDGARTELREQRTEASRLVDRLRGAIQTESEFSRAIGTLDGRVPITLLPVRLETRFTRNGRKLRVRIFPDTVHQDGHEPELTTEEVDAAVRYWRARWEKGGSERDAAAWSELARTFRPTRSRWLVETMTPTNLASLGTGEPVFPEPLKRPAPWTRAPTARVLPERWLVLAFRAETLVVQKWGRPVSDDLPMGPTPDLDAGDDEPADPPPDQDVLPVDEGLQWVVDFETAEVMGMGITIDEQDVTGGALAQGFDLLVVVGVDWTLAPGDAAARLEAHLAAHSYSDGLSFLPVGTPTNVTGEEAAATNSDVQRRPELLDPTTIAAVTADSSATRLREALGLAAPSVLEAAPNAAGRSDTAARHMNNALWAPTWGYFLEQMARPLVDLRNADLLHDHFRRFVRGRGPLPCLRLGKQPYGVLPVMPSGDGRPVAQGIEGELTRRLSSLRAQWHHSAGTVPRLGDEAAADEVVVDLLRRTPRSETFRFRKATGRAVASALFGLGLAAQFQELIARTLMELAAIDGRPVIVDVTLAEGSESLPVPFVASGALSDVDPLDPNYFRSVLVQLTKSGGFRNLVEDPKTAGSLLEALIRHAARLEMARVAFLVIVQAEVDAGIITRADEIPKEVEIHVPDAPARPRRASEPAGPASVLSRGATTLELALQPMRLVSGNKTVANHLATLSNAELRRKAATRRFADFRTSLDELAHVPSAELARLAAETLDCCSHRLDAWITSLATRRLSDLRSQGVEGMHIGGYGWVEDLRPQGAPSSLGYVHAPSMAQASAAAILRSGHLSRRASGDSVFSVDLSSERVARALEILEGVRAGQPVGALLGYRFERGLRERSLRLARYILEFRRAAPLDTATDGTDDSTPLEAVAARDVVDGVKLVRRARDRETELLDEVGVDTGDRAAVRAELGRLVDSLDGVSDVLVSEGVYQAVLGNAERSGAALDAIDRQTILPDVDVVRTPRTGVGVSHRLLIVCANDELPSGWSNVQDPRGLAEPRLNAWLGRAIGDPDLVRFRAIPKDAEGKPVGAALEARLTALKLSPMSTVLAAVGGGAGRATELQERLAAHFFGAVPAGTVSLEFDPDPPTGSPRSALGLAELTDLCAGFADLVGSCRPGSARDLVATRERVDEGFDIADLKQRADSAVTGLRRARNDLPEGGENPGVLRLRRTLLALADMGVRGAVPASADRAELIAQVAAVATAADERLAALKAVEEQLDRSAASASQQIEHDLARLRVIFGDSFPATPLFTSANADELGSALAAATTLVGDDVLAATLWLQQHALVRPAVGRLFAALTDAEMRGRDLGAGQLEVVQLPHRQGDRWVGQPVSEDAALHVGAASVVVHTVDGLDPRGQLAAWVVDQWSEVIPRRTETTGVSFHFDAPGARAPQSILLAVPPDPTAAGWKLDDVIGSVLEVIELTKMRAVDLDHLEAIGRFFPAMYLAFNLERKTPWLDLWSLANQAVELENTAFEGGSEPQ
jgi:hypothetical protein